jgi:Tfp pilus assembly protein PilN/energy-coupling factor transporter ATP-binding protein EcfA2
LLQRLHQHHFVAVVGNSGCGKSSLLRAGLIPDLKAGYLVDDGDQWIITIMKPGKNPLYNLAEAMLHKLKLFTKATDVSSLLQKINEEGVHAILNLVAHYRIEKNENFFLLVDQFEELFRLAMDQKDDVRKNEAIDFVNIILSLSQQRIIPFFVVITMRSDFIGDCAQFNDLPEAMNQSQYLVPRLNRVELKTAIEGPAKLYGGKLNPALTSRLLNETLRLTDELPLLQHALMRMWEFETQRTNIGEIEPEDYESVGGIEKALSNHADEALTSLSARDFHIAKSLFQALTAIDENGRKIRRPVLLSQLKAITGAGEKQLLAIINLFIKNGRSFLVVNKAGDTGDKVIDISHESLIRQWNTLSQWVDEEGESAAVYLQLAEATKMNKQKKKDYLTGSELQLLLEWRETAKPSPDWANRYKDGFEDCIEYLNASEAERTRLLNDEKKRKRKQQYLIYAVMGLLLIVAMAVIGVIMVKNNSIKRERNAQLEKIKAYEEAEQNKKLAADAEKRSSVSQAQKDSINFYKLETDVYTLLEVHDPARQQLNQMDSISRVNPDSIKMKARINSIISSESYKKAVKGNH